MLVDHLLKTKKESKKLKKQEIQDIFTEINLEKACFQHDMTYRDFKDLAKRATADKFQEIKRLILSKRISFNGL